MAEYIEREKVLSLQTDLHFDNIEQLKHWKCRHIDPTEVQLLPAADVRPVVLCRDCKFTKTDGMEDPAIYCEKWDRWEMPPDGFCWLGKKRKEINNEN